MKITKKQLAQIIRESIKEAVDWKGDPIGYKPTHSKPSGVDDGYPGIKAARTKERAHDKELWDKLSKQDEPDDDDHYGEPDDEKMAALTSLQSVLEECMRAGIPKEEIADTVAIWAASE
jgi:hypothetical protein